MHSDTAIAALRDIEHHIALAVHFATGFDYDTFRGDPRTVYAVTCCLEILSEASRRLPDELKARHPAIAWKDMAGAGNIYRHDYVWDAVQIDLPPLRVKLARATRLSGPGGVPPAGFVGAVLDGQKGPAARHSLAVIMQRHPYQSVT